MKDAAIRRLTVENHLRKAIGRGELTLYYQPGIRFDKRSHLWGGSFAPVAQYRARADFSCRIYSIGRRNRLDHPYWRMGTTHGMCPSQGLARRRISLPRIAVNISVLQFVQTDFTDLVAQILNETGLSPHALELEITEGLLMKDAEGAIRTLSILKDQGVQFAIDDFGTGYSSPVISSDSPSTD